MKRKKFFIVFIIMLTLMVSYVMNLKTTFANLTEKNPNPNLITPAREYL